MGNDEKAWTAYLFSDAATDHAVGTREAFAAGRASQRSRIAALEAENEKLQKAARASVRRLEKAAQYCGDPQHPIWDGGRLSEKARLRVDGLLDILDPFRPELEDASDEDWDRIYKLDPIDAYVSDYEERAEGRVAALEAVITRVKDMADRDDARAWDAHQGLIALVLAESPSTVLDQVIREAKAEALARLQEMRGGDIEQEYIDAVLGDV